MSERERTGGSFRYEDTLSQRPWRGLLHPEPHETPAVVEIPRDELIALANAVALLRTIATSRNRPSDAWAWNAAETLAALDSFVSAGRVAGDE